MKKYLTTICVAVFGLAFQATPAHAGDEGWAAFGGFVGGYLVNEFSHHRHHAPRRNYRRASTCSSAPAPVYVQQPVVVQPVYHAPAPPPPCGHWETRNEKYWVQGQWAIQHTRCGPRRTWHEGHWATRSKRVWVEDTHTGYQTSPHQGNRNGYYP